MKFKLISLIRVLIFFLFFIALIYNINIVFDFLNYSGEEFSWSSFKLHHWFRSSFILLVPFIGVFLKNRIGWICITQYFYFLLLNLFLQLNKSEFEDFEFLLFIFGMFSILLFLIIVMNKRALTEYYKIPTRDIFPNNIFASIIGFSISFFLFLENNSEYILSNY